MMPPSLSNLFQKKSEIHSYNTGGADKLRAPKIKSTLSEKCITFSGV